MITIRKIFFKTCDFIPFRVWVIPPRTRVKGLRAAFLPLWVLWVLAFSRLCSLPTSLLSHASHLPLLPPIMLLSPYGANSPRSRLSASMEYRHPTLQLLRTEWCVAFRLHAFKNWTCKAQRDELSWRNFREAGQETRTRKWAEPCME